MDVSRHRKVNGNPMAKASEARTYEESLAWLRDHGFDTTDAPGTAARVFLRKYNVSAAIEKTREDGVKIFGSGIGQGKINLHFAGFLVMFHSVDLT